jgi:uncharacterized protein (TIGR00251 family)
MNDSNINNFKISKLPDGIKFSVKVSPNSSKCEICGIVEDYLKIKLDVPPIEGKANEKLIKFLSKILGIPKTSIEITSGETGRNKVLFIKGDAELLEKKIKRVCL